jgi:hypothetical protein
MYFGCSYEPIDQFISGGVIIIIIYSGGFIGVFKD